MANTKSDIVAAAQKVAKLQALEARVRERLIDLKSNIDQAVAELRELTKDAA
jgi:hypothetical protein